MRITTAPTVEAGGILLLTLIATLEASVVVRAMWPLKKAPNENLNDVSFRWITFPAISVSIAFIGWWWVIDGPISAQLNLWGYLVGVMVSGACAGLTRLLR